MILGRARNMPWKLKKFEELFRISGTIIEMLNVQDPLSIGLIYSEFVSFTVMTP